MNTDYLMYVCRVEIKNKHTNPFKGTQVKYENIVKVKLSRGTIAKLLRYKHSTSLCNSTKYRDIMEFADYCIGLGMKHRQSEIDKLKIQVEGL
jgi:hypothetical protein